MKAPCLFCFFRRAPLQQGAYRAKSGGISCAPRRYAAPSVNRRVSGGGRCNQRSAGAASSPRARLCYDSSVASLADRYEPFIAWHVYLIDHLPVKLNVDEVVMTAAITLAICLLATVYPALRAARLPPVDGLRYE